MKPALEITLAHLIQEHGLKEVLRSLSYAINDNAEKDDDILFYIAQNIYNIRHLLKP